MGVKLGVTIREEHGLSMFESGLMKMLETQGE
jgi:hypothetical protein